MLLWMPIWEWILLRESYLKGILVGSCIEAGHCRVYCVSNIPLDWANMVLPQWGGYYQKPFEVEIYCLTLTQNPIIFYSYITSF